MDPFLAQIVLFGGNFAPRGWAFCDGQLLAISQYSALFSLLGTTYGGDGRTTFALPDLRGRAPVHKGSGPGLPTVNLGAKFGTHESYLTTANLPNHSHTGTVKVADGRGKAQGAPNNYLVSKPVDESNTPVIKTSNFVSSADATFTAGNSVQGVETNSTPGAGNQGFSNQSPALGLNFIIALQGTYPSRS